jgi:excisionase family DNA binding protein
MGSKFYTTSEAAKRVGVSRQTLQTWIASDRVGVLPTIIGGVRLWTDPDLARLRKIRAKSKVGRPKKGKKSKVQK